MGREVEGIGELFGGFVGWAASCVSWASLTLLGEAGDCVRGLFNMNVGK